MHRFTVPLALAAFALTACQQSAAPPESDASPTAAPAPTAATPASTETISAPATATAIPERFRGIWDSGEGRCNPASELGLEIGAASIEFYESLGAVTGVTVESPDSIVVDLAMEGEGERWTRTNRYVLSDGGATLTPSEVGGPPSAAIPRTRCAN